MTMTFPCETRRWMVTPIPDDYTVNCPQDFDEDRFLEHVLMAVNLSNHDYQCAEQIETLAHSFMNYTGSDDVTLENEEYSWYLAEQAVGDAKSLFPYVKPGLKTLEDDEGFGVDINEVYLDPLGIMFTVEAV